MLRWIVDLWRRLFCHDHLSPAPPSKVRRFRPVPLARYDGADEPPAMHWKPCHPRTATRFKAHMTCGSGHPVVLKDHAIQADGAVQPSVVCRAPGCRFHDFVVLAGWTGGDIP